MHSSVAGLTFVTVCSWESVPISWTGCSQSWMQPLDWSWTFQSLRHISDEIRANLHWLPVRQRISYKVCFLVRNCLAGAAPEYLSEVCQSTSSTSGCQHLCSALRNDLLVPRVRTANYGARGFAVSGPRLWNSLPMSVRELYDKPEQFKKAPQNISYAAVASASVYSYQKWRYTKFLLRLRLRYKLQ